MVRKVHHYFFSAKKLTLYHKILSFPNIEIWKNTDLVHQCHFREKFKGNLVTFLKFQLALTNCPSQQF